VLPLQKGHFQGFQEGICSLSKKEYFCILKRVIPFTKFKKAYAPSLKRIIPRNSRRDIL
jgi:hypothetical protein